MSAPGCPFCKYSPLPLEDQYCPGCEQYLTVGVLCSTTLQQTGPTHKASKELASESRPKAASGGYGQALGGAVVGAVGALAYGNALVGAAVRPR
jgi:hypothetical protein